MLHVFVHLNLFELEQVILCLEACNLFVQLKRVIVEAYNFVAMLTLRFFLYCSYSAYLRQHTLVKIISDHALRDILLVE